MNAIDERVCLAEELWATIRLRSGQIGRELPRLWEAAVSQPHREIRWQQLVEASTMSGRRVEALRAAHQAREALAEFGILPGPGLQSAEQAALRSDVATEEPPGARRLDAMRAMPVAGRRRLLDRLAVSPQMTLLVGDSGHGTTRVLAEFAHEMRSNGSHVLYVACGRSSAGLQLIADLALEMLAGERAGTTVSSELAALLGKSSTESDDIYPVPEVRGVRIRAALTDLLLDAAVHHSVVVLVDNIQWLDCEVSKIIAHLVNRAPTNVRFVFAGRTLADDGGSLLHSELNHSCRMATFTVGPLEPDDIDVLADLLAPDLDPAQRAVLAADAWRLSSGHPLFASELIRTQLETGLDHAPAPQLESIVVRMLDELDVSARTLADALSIIDRACHIDIAAAASNLTPHDACTAVRQLRAQGVLLDTGDETITFRLELIGDVVRQRVARADATRVRRRLIKALDGLDREPLLLVEQLLALDSLEPDERAILDRATSVVLRQQLAAVDYDAALTIGRAYLETVGTADTGPSSVQVQLLVATALLAQGDAPGGRALLDLAIERARAIDDPRLLVDAVLARGPIDTGSSQSRRIADEAEALICRLPTDDVARRVQLACWAAHHRLNHGDRNGATTLLDRIVSIASTSPTPVWRGLILAVQAQAEQLAGGTASRAQTAHDRLRAWAKLTGDESTEAATRLLAAGLAFTTGTLADVRRARDDIADVALTIPRPDLRWLPDAIDAALALAVDDHQNAAAAIRAAEICGRRLGVSAAGPTAMMQQTQLMILNGTIGSMAALLEPAEDGLKASVELISLYGLACARAGELGGARRSAVLLRDREGLLAGGGTAWPVVAMAGSELAWFTRDRILAQRIWSELRRWSGVGLSVHAVAYFGAADTWLGILADVLGRRSVSIHLLSSAAAQERRRGAVAWERRAVELRAAVTASSAQVQL